MSTPPHRFPGWLAAALLLGLTAAAYLPSLGNGFVWDDDIALTQNPMVRSDAGLHQFWLTTQPPDYWPMTASTLWVEWRLWGMEASGYHATNLALHLVEVLLLWRILRRLRIPGAYLGALLFAVHPVNVESVAWITQRKNLVAMLFYLLSIYGFIRWSAPTPARLPPDALEPARRGRRAPPGIWYALSLLAFGLAMLSKGSVAILPLVLLGILAWDRRIAAKDLVRLAPFFLVAGALALVDVWFQKHHLVGNEVIRHAGWLERLLGAGAAVWFYLGKALLPVRLAFFYPLWHIESASVGWWLPLLGAIGLTLFLWRKNRVSSPSFVIPSAARNLPFAATEIPRSARNGQITGYGIWRGALFAWGYFCVALVPVLGFTDVYFMKFSLVANHYQHLALIGVTTLAGAAWAGAMNERRKPGMSESRKSGLNESRKPALILAAVAVVGLLAILTWRQCRNYRDPETLMVATLEENPGSALAHENLGVILGNTHRLPEAMAQLEEALRLQPGFADADSNLGALLVEQGRIPEGMAHYQAALRSNPDLFVVHLNLGSLLLYQHRWEEARSELQTAVRLRPASADARALLARAQQAATGVTGAAAGAPGAAAGNPSFP